MSGVYTALADLIVVSHFAYLAVLIFGGVAAWHWPWLIRPHVAALAWGVGAVTLRYDCPLTALEQHLRKRAGHGLSPDGFLRHYVRGVLFPERLTPLVVLVMAGLVVTGWVGLALRRARARSGLLGHQEGELQHRVSRH